MIERKIKSGRMTISESAMWRGYIDNAIASGNCEFDDAEYQWARRLRGALDAYGQKLEVCSGSA